MIFLNLQWVYWEVTPSYVEDMYMVSSEKQQNLLLQTFQSLISCYPESNFQLIWLFIILFLIIWLFYFLLIHQF